MAESGEDKEGEEDRGPSAGQGLIIAKPLPLLAQLAGSLVQGWEHGGDATNLGNASLWHMDTAAAMDVFFPPR